MDEQPSKPLTPLHMPSGSVRALVALTVVGVVLAETMRNREIGLLLTETLLIVMAHYFASRRLINLPPETLKQYCDQAAVLLDGQLHLFDSLEEAKELYEYE